MEIILKLTSPSNLIHMIRINNPAKSFLSALILILIVQFSFAQGNDKTAIRNQWMEGNYGLMVHWLAPNFDGSGKTPLAIRRDYQADLNAATDGFDLDLFIKEFDKTGADWLIFTIGQNTGTYASPNSIIDSLCGPGHTSERDLVLEIARAVKLRGKRFIAYLPCEIKANTTLHEGFGWTTEPGTDQAVFQENYLKVIREWSLRLGNLCDGWWFDGCYDWEYFNNKYILWDKWYLAAREGNKNAVVTFNDGSFLTGKMEPVRSEHDYTSGESLVLVNSRIRAGLNDDSPLFIPEQKYVTGTKCLYHALLPIDGYWALNRSKFPDWANIPFEYTLPANPAEMPKPIYDNDHLFKFVKDFTQSGGAVTLNANISQEGYLSDETIKQMKALKKAMRKNH